MNTYLLLLLLGKMISEFRQKKQANIIMKNIINYSNAK